MPGFTWVSFDGTDCVGKTTLLEGVASCLQDAMPEYQVEALPEFSPTSVGELIQRRIDERYFFQMGDNGHLPVGETLILAADLALQIETLQRQQTDRPLLLVSDRGPLSLVIYQAYRIARHTGCDTRTAAQWVHQVLSLLPAPDLTVVVHVEETALRQRLRDRNPDLSEADVAFVMELQEIFLSAVYEGNHDSHAIVHNTTDHSVAVQRIAQMVARLQ